MPLADETAAEIQAAVEAAVPEKEEIDNDESLEQGEAGDNQVEDEEDGGEDGEEEGEDYAGGEGNEGGGLEEDSGEGGGGDAEDEGGEDDGEEEYVPDEQLLTQAIMLGIPIADAINFPSDEALAAAINSIRRSIEMATPVKEEEPEEEEDPLKDFPELDPEVFEPEAIKVLGSLKEVIKKQAEKLKALETRQADSGRNARAADAKEVEQWFDKQIEGLGDDFVDSLGKGGYSSLRQGSPQLANRDAIAQQMAVMLAGYQATGMPVPPREQVFDLAAGIVLSGDFAKAKEKKLASKLEKRQGQHVRKTVSKKLKSKLSPEEEVAELLNSKFFGK